MYFKEAFIYITGVALCINIALTFFYFCTGAQFSTDLFGMHFLTQQLATMLCLVPAYPFMRKKNQSTPKDEEIETENIDQQNSKSSSFSSDFPTVNPVLYRSSCSKKEGAKEEELKVVIYGSDHTPVQSFNIKNH